MSDKSNTDITKPLVLLVVLHVGMLVGLSQLSTQAIFTKLIPLNLLVTLGVMLYFQKHWNIRIILFCLATVVATFLIEVAGIKTGEVFGVFRFGKTLGPKLFDVPVIMGLTWLLLIYAVGVMMKNAKFSVWTNAAIGAAMMVMLDVLIEPVAFRYGMWSFHKNRVPLLNYFAWFVISYAFLSVILNLRAKLRNELAPYVFCVIVGFFLIANLL